MLIAALVYCKRPGIAFLRLLLNLEMVFRPSAQLQGQGEAELLEDNRMIDSASFFISSASETLSCR